MNNLKTIAIYMACVSVAFSEDAFCLDEELKSGYVNYRHPKGLTACKTTLGVGLHSFGSLT